MSYPTHEFSKYIDSHFSANNNLSTETADDRMLEPRLIDYMKKKKYYKLNNVRPLVPLEKDFNITKHDLKTINLYISKLKQSKKQNTTQKLSYKTQFSNKSQFPSKKFKHDKRVPQLKKPIQKQVQNLGMFMPDDKGSYYDTYLNTNTDMMLDSRDLNNKNINKPIDTPLRYNKTYNHTNPPPTVSALNYSEIDHELEMNMLKGTPSHTTKSYGYKNPSEHYFDYVDPRYTNMELFPRGGVSTRMDNTKQAKKQEYERFII